MERPGAYSPARQEQEHASAEQPEQNVENLEGFIEILSQHQKKCEEEGKYVEAEMAMNRIKELK